MRLLLLLPLLAATAQAQIAFDPSPADRVRISSPTYEIAFSKTNGAILSIRDPKAATDLTLGSRNGCLWGAGFASPTLYRGGCNTPDPFHYAWDATRATMILTYGNLATVTAIFHSDSFTLQIALANSTGSTLKSVLFPSDLAFAAAQVSAVYLPYHLPGVKLTPQFFAAHRSVAAIYPSARAFADYLALDIASSHLAYYSVNPSAAISPVDFGIRDDDKLKPGAFYLPHAFQTETPDGARWQSPAIVFRIGETARQTIDAYRRDNRIADYPSLASKLQGLPAGILQAPMVKMDFAAMHQTFAEAEAALDKIQTPALLHPVAYWPRGFDKNYPDFLPPNPALGTQADFLKFVQAAHARKLFVMPYTNVTWWDVESPTVKSFGPDPAALAVQQPDGTARYESYGPNRGFASSLHSPAVVARAARLMAQWRTEVPMDFVFNDQIGSRSWLRDFNPASSNPLDYADLWLAFTRQYQAQRLMTEDGFDRLAETETGFAGSTLTGAKRWDPATVRWGQASNGNNALGAGNWEPYPLADWLFHDKVLFYQHDLDSALNAGIEVLTWNCAFGVMGGYLWPELRGSNPLWVATINAFQPAVLSRLAGKLLDSYRELAPGVTESRFGDISVIANWNPGKPYDAGTSVLAPSGVLVRSDSGDLTAGVFVQRFQGKPLPDGVHYLLATALPPRASLREISK